ncbi:DUF928 domain-containing protein [Laspinema palackyanum]|uniref:DUF928 domain-containing protein n=1 Tax=Laspinema palackyanum TaxID=3231601 RepID=UPI00345DB6F6|nr:DUF928 domain-containing protein [Laspinema sp. D2c]
MARQQTNVPLTLLFTLSLNVAWVGGIFNPAQAQSSSDAQRLQTGAIAQVTFNPPGKGQPRNTAGGASRDGNSCVQEPQLSSGCVTPLSPEAYQGLTVADRPTFYVYVPKTSARELFFALKDENNQHHYQTSIPVPEGEGAVMAIALPDDAPPLEIGQTYSWTFILIDETGLKPDSPGVQGDIRRVEANSLTLGSQQADPTLELAQQYGNAGIWYDMMTTLVQLRQSSPNDPTILESWMGLLASVGLESIATKPIAQP